MCWQELEVNLTDPGTLPKAEIEPNTCYNFRVIAINSCGLSEPSDEATLKSCVEGVPRAPTGVKITRVGICVLYYLLSCDVFRDFAW